MRKGADTCDSIGEYVSTVSGGMAWYDARIFGYDFTPLEEVITYMFLLSDKHEDLQKSIHLDNSTRKPLFSFTSKEVKSAYRTLMLQDYSQYYNYILENHPDFPLIISVGEFDTRDGFKSQTKWMRNTLNLTDNFWSQSRKTYYFEDNNQTKIGGYYRSEGSFTFLTVPKAGHFVPYGNYKVSKLVLDDFVKHGKIQCNDPNNQECKVDHLLCDAMN